MRCNGYISGYNEESGEIVNVTLKGFEQAYYHLWAIVSLCLFL